MLLHHVRQRLVSAPIADVTADVRRQLDALPIDVPRGEVAITAGSRGIAAIAEILRAAGDWLRQRGASPFIIPAMGSHNGATAEGQVAMLTTLGITEEATGLPIRASMDCVKIGSVASGDVWMDRYAYEADGVLVVNRVKLHTIFSGPVQSGLAKMMVVGMGKIRSAETFHSAPNDTKAEMLLEMGRVVVETGKVWAGLAILEDGFDKTAELHAIPGVDILQRELELLERHRTYFPRLPVEDINVLVVDQIGKDFSGTGMDTNVIGYRGIRGSEDLTSPEIRIIAALNLSEASHGNALGVGLADFCTRRLRDAIDERKTLVNVLTTGEMQRIRIPATLEDDDEVVATIRRRFGDARWVFIPNTLHLESLFVTPDLAAELADHPKCEVAPNPIELTFDKGRHTLGF